MAEATDSKIDGDEKQNTDFEHMKSVWESYDSIQNFKSDQNHKKSVQTKEYLLETKQAGDDVDWVATEKIHGCNFSMVTNGVQIFGGRRGALMEPGTKFITGWEDLVQQEKPKIIKIFELLKKQNDAVNVVVVYGEIFGRYFTHPDKKYSGGGRKQAVQVGISYTPQLMFYAFDIKTNLHEKENERLEYCQARQLFQQVGLLQGDVLIKGKFEDVIKFDVESFQSTMPKMLGLPQPADDQGRPVDNTAEGIVVRKLTGSNFLLKIKSSKFDEIENAPKKKVKKNANGKGNKSAQDVRKEMIEKGIDESMIDFIDACVNENRFAAVVSKVGQFSKEICGRIKGMMLQDVWKELNESKEDELKAIAKQKQGMLKKYISVYVAQYLDNKVAEL